MTLEGRVCVVTGASSGIGEACLRALRAEGATVVGMARRARETADELILATDVTDEVSVRRSVTEVLRRHGTIDVCVLSAGVDHTGSLVETPHEVWDRLLAVNVTGCYHILRQVIPGMQARRWGRIIIVSSNYGVVGGRNHAAYAATKGATVQLARSLALDLAPDGIRVNCVAPGTIETPMVTEPMKTMSAAEVEATNARRRTQHPLGRIGRPEEVAAAVVWLAGDESSFVTGAVIAVDGGFTAQ